MEVEAAPRLSDEPLGKIHAARLIFLEERFHICHLDRGQDQRAFARGEFGEVRLMDEPQVKARTIARHGTVKGRLSVKKINVEAEFHLVENRCRLNVTYEQYRDGANQGRPAGIDARRAA